MITLLFHGLILFDIFLIVLIKKLLFLMLKLSNFLIVKLLLFHDFLLFKFSIFGNFFRDLLLLEYESLHLFQLSLHHLQLLILLFQLLIFLFDFFLSLLQFFNLFQRKNILRMLCDTTSPQTQLILQFLYFSHVLTNHCVFRVFINFWLVFNVSCSSSISQGSQSLIIVEGCRRNTSDHQGLGITP